MIEFVSVADKKCGRLSVEQNRVTARTFNSQCAKRARHLAGHRSESRINRRVLPGSNRDVAAIHGEAVVGQLHLVITGTEIDRMVLARLPDRVPVYKDISLRRCDVNLELAVLSHSGGLNHQ